MLRLVYVLSALVDQSLRMRLFSQRKVYLDLNRPGTEGEVVLQQARGRQEIVEKQGRFRMDQVHFQNLWARQHFPLHHIGLDYIFINLE